MAGRKKSPNPVFADEIAVLRYAIDALVPQTNDNPINPLMSPVIGELENIKLTRLISHVEFRLANGSPIQIVTGDRWKKPPDSGGLRDRLRR